MALNIVFFQPYLGKWSTFTSIFLEMGWNHQLPVAILLYLSHSCFFWNDYINPTNRWKCMTISHRFVIYTVLFSIRTSPWIWKKHHNMVKALWNNKHALTHTMSMCPLLTVKKKKRVAACGLGILHLSWTPCHPFASTNFSQSEAAWYRLYGIVLFCRPQIRWKHLIENLRLTPPNAIPLHETRPYHGSIVYY